jgi:hypothetical protein
LNINKKKRKLCDSNPDLPLSKKLAIPADEPDQANNTLSKFPEFYYYYLNALNQQQQQQQQQHHQNFQQQQKAMFESSHMNGNLKFPTPFLQPNYLLQPILNSVMNVENFYKQTNQSNQITFPALSHLSQPNPLPINPSAAASLLFANYRNLLANSKMQPSGSVPNTDCTINSSTILTSQHSGLLTPPKSSSSSSTASFQNLKSTFKSHDPKKHLLNNQTATTLLLNKNLNIPSNQSDECTESHLADNVLITKKKIKQESKSNEENIMNEFDNNDANSNLSLDESAEGSKLDTSSLSADVC